MAKDEAYKEKMNEQMKRSKNLTKNSVIISVYVESPTIRKRRISDPSMVTMQKPLSTTYGYNRKAQLLAYSRQLRCSNSQQIEWPRKNLRSKSKWNWVPSGAKFRSSFQKTFRPAAKRRWRYEQMVSVDRSCSWERINRRKTTAGRGSNSRNFCKRIWHMLKELSCGWKCNKGS
ncbi:hypothetical protein HHK36_009051 [Tetracentron sinense]|uniref:Uncharacterized protein n=1 Tax=Tetracentron sinense TaxID=13715 RepID=A0A834ZCW3_TETSI|nr:hypothetical protein HHK36_009051 [Tetracentron sinense]